MRVPSSSLVSTAESHPTSPRAQAEKSQACVYSVVPNSVTLWTVVACQAPLSTGFPRQEYWSGLPFPPPGDLSDPGIKPWSLASPALAGGFFTTEPTWEALEKLQEGLITSA